MSSRRTLPLLLVALLLAGAAAAGSVEILRGRLQTEEGQAPAEGEPLVVITEKGKPVTVVGDIFSEGQLRDPRLAGRTWEFEGKFTDDGRFEIFKLFTIKDGRRHRVTYYCEICHIYTHEPGRCMCCQDETELREIPES